VRHVCGNNKEFSKKNSRLPPHNRAEGLVARTTAQRASHMAETSSLLPYAFCCAPQQKTTLHPSSSRVRRTMEVPSFGKPLPREPRCESRNFPDSDGAPTSLQAGNASDTTMCGASKVFLCFLLCFSFLSLKQKGAPLFLKSDHPHPDAEV